MKVPDYHDQFGEAVRSYRLAKQTSGGTRGGKHMSAFEKLIVRVVEETGLVVDEQPDKKLTLPGYYREGKDWDVILQYKGHVLAVVEAKSQGTSLAKNFNNRVEEAVGQAADVWKAYERGFLSSGMRPWVGYLMIIDDIPETSTIPSSSKTTPGDMGLDPTFKGMTRAERYAEAFARLDQERMLDATCVSISHADGSYSFPSDWLSFNGFAAQLWGRCRHMQAVLG